MNVTVIKQTESVIYNGKIYSYGQSFEADDLIGKSLIQRGYVAPSAIEEEVHEETSESDDLNNMSYAELKRYASQLGIDAKGKKDELIAKIKAYDESESVEEEEEVEEDTDGDLPNTSMPE